MGRRKKYDAIEQPQQNKIGENFAYYMINIFKWENERLQLTVSEQKKEIDLLRKQLIIVGLPDSVIPNLEGINGNSNHHRSTTGGD